MTRYWFAKRKFGMGVRPASTAGWLSALALLLSLLAIHQYVLPTSDSEAFIAGGLIIAAFVLLVIFKTDWKG